MKFGRLIMVIKKQKMDLKMDDSTCESLNILCPAIYLNSDNWMRTEHLAFWISNSSLFLNFIGIYT